MILKCVQAHHRNSPCTQVGTFLLDVVRNAVGSKTKTLKMARRLKQSMEQHSTKRSVRLQQNVLADIAAALGPTCQYLCLSLEHLLASESC